MLASKLGVAPCTLGVYLYMRACKVLQGFDSRHLAACAARCFRESTIQSHSYGTEGSYTVPQDCYTPVTVY